MDEERRYSMIHKEKCYTDIFYYRSSPTFLYNYLSQFFWIITNTYSYFITWVKNMDEEHQYSMFF